MSSRSSYFLTCDRNEHAYSDCFEPVEDVNGQYVGDAITLEFSKSNIRIELSDEQYMVLTLNVDSDLFRTIKRALDLLYKDLKAADCISARNL